MGFAHVQFESIHDELSIAAHVPAGAAPAPIRRQCLLRRQLSGQLASSSAGAPYDFCAQTLHLKTLNANNVLFGVRDSELSQNKLFGNNMQPAKYLNLCFAYSNLFQPKI